MDIYKQKYEHALDNFKKIKAANKDNKELVNFIEYEYPELKESEDEKIRKELLDYLEERRVIERLTDTKVKKEWIAWLEKQGEHANFRNKIQIGDEVTRNEDGVLVNLSQFKRMVKQREQKLTWSEEDERYYDSALWHIKNSCGIEGNVYNWLKSLKERMKGE